jgi:hypothetical protein
MAGQSPFNCPVEIRDEAEVRELAGHPRASFNVAY